MRPCKCCFDGVIDFERYNHSRMPSPLIDLQLTSFQHLFVNGVFSMPQKLLERKPLISIYTMRYYEGSNKSKTHRVATFSISCEGYSLGKPIESVVYCIKNKLKIK